MKIGKKLAAGFGLSLVILLVVGWGAHRNAISLMETGERVTRTHRVQTLIREVHVNAVEAQSGLRGYSLTGDEVFLEPYQSALQRMEGDLADLEKAVSDNPAQRERMRALRPRMRQFLEGIRTRVALRKEQGLEAALAGMKTLKGDQEMEEVRKILGSMEDEEQSLLQQRESDAAAAAQGTVLTLALGTAIAVLLVSIAGFLISRDITLRVGALQAAAERIAAGELSLSVPVAGGDEVAALGTSFRAMTANLRRMIEAEKAGRERLDALFKAISDSADSVSSASLVILAGTTRQAAGAQEQSAAVAETVSTVDEVLHTSEQATQRAKAVSESTQRAAEVGQAGRKDVEETIASMGAVKEQTESIAESIMALAEKAQEIGEIIAAVNDIAEQVNLLALNAAIEASRAGEQGKGFAVVAAEIKALADTAKKSTAQVRQILGDIQKATNSAVMVTEEGTKRAGTAIKVANQAGETIRVLSDVIGSAAQAAPQIAASAGQQAMGMAQIHQAMRNVNQVSSQNLAATHQAEKAASDIGAHAGRLRQLLTGYAR